MNNFNKKINELMSVLSEESKGLWHNINKAKKSGKISSKWKNDPKYRKQMKDQAYKIERKKK